MVSYCERSVEHHWFDSHWFGYYWAEPLNTVTNLAFICVAMQVWNQKRRPEAQNSVIQSIVVATLLVLVAIGSGLYHSAPSQLTLILDIAPILGLCAVLTFILLTKYTALSTGKTTLLTAIMIGASMLSGGLPWFNGSLFYFPLWVTMLLLSVFCWKSEDRLIGLAILCSFSVAITARTIDLIWCENIVIGTHFLWHLFAALSAALAVRLAR